MAIHKVKTLDSLNLKNILFFISVPTMSQQSNLVESVHKLHDSKNKNGIENDDIDEEEELDPRVQVITGCNIKNGPPEHSNLLCLGGPLFMLHPVGLSLKNKYFNHGLFRN